MELTAYCLKTKTKNVPFKGKPELIRTSKGGFMLKGQDKDGNKMSAIVSSTTANEAIKLGLVVEVK
jgi:hypothetical protein